VCSSDLVRAIVVSPNEVRKSLGGIGREMINEVERPLFAPERGDELRRREVSGDPRRLLRNIVDETAGKTLSIGQAMYTEYLLPVEIVGVLLLMAIIGGVILVRRLEPTELKLVIDHELDRRHEEQEKDDFRVAL